MLDDGTITQQDDICLAERFDECSMNKKMENALETKIDEQNESGFRIGD